MVDSPRLTEALRDAIVSTVRRPGPDLSARQLAILLVCSVDGIPQTGRGLASRLGVPRSVVTLATDRLEVFGLAKREKDARDRRSVLIVATAAGRALTGELASAMAATART
jgi:DNA-binding MarR family transcriptional regulator